MVSEETMRWFAEWVVLGSFVMAFLIATVRSVNLRETTRAFAADDNERQHQI